MHLRVPNNIGRALKTVPTLLFYFAVITEQQKCWELLAQKFDQFKLCATTSNSTNNMQQGGQTNATRRYPTMLGVIDQHCCVRLHGALLFKTIAV